MDNIGEKFVTFISKDKVHLFIKIICIAIIFICGIVLIVMSQTKVDSNFPKQVDTQENFFDDCDAHCDDCAKEPGVCGVEVDTKNLNVPIVISAPFVKMKLTKEEEKEKSETCNVVESRLKNLQKTASETLSAYLKRALELRQNIVSQGYDVSDDEFAKAVERGQTPTQ